MVCLNCGRKLKSVASREAGYDPVCHRKMFGISLRISCRDRGLGAAGASCYDIPGQMTVEEYPQAGSGEQKKGVLS